jgi:hypothetical protein
MSQSIPLSPRQEALNSILQVCTTYPSATISPGIWDKLVGIAWENRTQAGDRREIQRHLRQVLLESARNGNLDDAAS